MRWCAALAVVLVVLVVLTIKSATRRSKQVAITDEGPIADVETPHAAPPASWTPSMRPATTRAGEERRDRIGVARIKGRVLVPAREPGEETDEGTDTTGSVSVTADDGSRTFSARMLPGGRYSFHLPPGTYTLVAYDGELVGVESDVAIQADKEREVDIRLGPGAVISGSVQAPPGSEVTVTASLSGSASGDVEPEPAAGDTFTVNGLLIGRRYDLVFSGPTVRTTTLRGVVAPTQGLDVVLSGLPIVRGAIGFPRGEKCPITEVELRSPGPGLQATADPPSTQPDRECRFELPAPGDTAEVMVVATGPGWFVEERVRIPSAGDPEEICLNPPCRADPLEGLARLRIAVDGLPPGTRIRANASSSGSYAACGGAGACEIEGLTPGETFLVGVRGEGCRSDSRKIVLSPGGNSATFTCQRERRIDGVIRLTTRAQQPERLLVRCRGGEIRLFDEARVFHLNCGADVADLEYRVDSGPWLSVPVPQGDRTAPALVEISL
jgi:hypothetical protein